MEKPAEEYITEHWVENEIWNHLYWPKHKKRLKKCAELCCGEKFADVGCACGHSTDIMRKYAPGDWTGVDFSATAIELAPGYFDDIEFQLVESLDALSNLNGFNFDSIVCSEVLEHVEEDRKLVEGLWAAASKRVIFSTPSVHVNDPGHLRLYDEPSLNALFEGIPHEIENIGSFFYVVCDKQEVAREDRATPAVVEIADSERITLDGQDMFVDLRDKVISKRLSCGHIYDPILRAIIREHVRPGMTVVDVGGHIGWQTVLMSRMAKKNGSVWAIEPSMRNAQFLKANIEMNGCKNVKVLDMAAWDAEIVMDLYLSPANTGDHNFIEDCSRKTVSVQTMKLDTIGRADFVKIDAQGSELAILRGARGLIENSPNLKMVVEYWPKGLSAFDDPMETIRELRENFDISVLRASVPIDQMLKKLTPKSGRFVNLFCQRKV